MDIAPSLIEGIILLVLAGLGGWLARLSSRVTDTQLDLAKNYHTKEELREAIASAIKPLTEAIEQLRLAMERHHDR